MRLILQIIIVYLCAHGMVVLAIEMYHERLELHGFNAFAALFGFIPFVCICAALPLLIVGLGMQFLLWIFKAN